MSLSPALNVTCHAFGRAGGGEWSGLVELCRAGVQAQARQQRRQASRRPSAPACDGRRWLSAWCAICWPWWWISVAGVRHQDGARFTLPSLVADGLAGVDGLPGRESLYPLHSVRRMLALIAALAVGWPGASGRVAPDRRLGLAPLHWMFGLASYALCSACRGARALMNQAEQRLRRRPRASEGLPAAAPGTTDLQFVTAGVVVLSLAILLGWWFTPHWRWDHKNLLSVLGWLVLTALLLAGRRLYGWRGRRAMRWLYAGAGLLLLAYVGTRALCGGRVAAGAGVAG